MHLTRTAKMVKLLVLLLRLMYQRIGIGAACNYFLSHAIQVSVLISRPTVYTTSTLFGIAVVAVIAHRFDKPRVYMKLQKAIEKNSLGEQVKFEPILPGNNK